MTSFFDTLPAAPVARYDALYAKAGELMAIPTDKMSDADVTLSSQIVDAVKALEPTVQKAREVARFRDAARPSRTYGAGGFEDFPATSRKTLGSGRGTVSSGFTAAMTKALSAGGSDGEIRKTLMSPGNLTAFNFGGPILDQLNAPLRIVDLCQQINVTTPSGTTLQGAGRSYNVQTVPLGAVKPKSTLGIVQSVWRIATIATWVGPVYRQWMSDYADLGAFFSREIGYGLNQELNSFLLNGGTAETGDTITGILNSGAPTQAFVTDQLDSLALGIASLTSAGTTPTAIAMNPTDWVAITMLRNTATGAFLLGGPAEQTEPKVWGLPVATDIAIPTGKAIIADWATVDCLHREEFTIESFATGEADAATTGGTYASRVDATDLTKTNQLLVRGEGRYGVHLERLESIRIVNLSA